MDNFKTMFQEMMDWLSHPFRKDMPIYQLLLIFILFLIVAFVVLDMLRILKSWMETATETVVEAVT